ncbi:MAG: hypothetical protein KAY22_02300 [Rhizorhabdus sp.]|uniref:hypothetical protein n=1 Tax=Rhizorhabdus sp. TaxID=1968843 RepID=UPI001B6B45E9|nr:hypothetical protein [Rhizorhabdus sp.]MBP8231112.1 hypothetical protein [Rhizorhabdus sp.]
MTDFASEIASALAQEASVGRIAFSLAMGALAASTALVLGVPGLSRLLLDDPTPVSLADHLPFAEILQGGRLLRCTDGSLAATIKVEGTPVSGRSSEEIRGLYARRRNWVDGLAGKSVEVRVFSRRQKRQRDLDVADDGRVSSMLIARFEERFAEAYETDHTIVLSVRGGSEGARRRLEEAIDLTLGQLEPFRPREIIQTRERISDLLSWWARIVNPATAGPVARLPEGDPTAAAALVGGPVEIDDRDGLLQFSSGPGSEKFGYFVTVARWGAESAEELVGRLLSLQVELAVCHRFRVLDATEADVVLSKKEQLAASARFSRSIEQQYEAVKEAVSPGSALRSSLVPYELAVLALGNSPGEAMATANAVRKVFMEFSVNPVIERDLAVPYYFAQFPTYDDRYRQSLLVTHNIAEFVAFEAWPRGMGRSAFGNGPLLLLPTEAGTPYQAQLHISEDAEALSHLMAIGKPGSGKTTGMCLLATGAIARHENVKVVVMDRRFGCYTWARSLGPEATYASLQKDYPGTTSASLQPLQRDLTQANLEHIRRMIRLMCNTDETDNEAETAIGHALRTLVDLPKEHRTFTALWPMLRQSRSTEAGFQKWIDPKQHGSVFNAGVDNVPLGKTRVTVFDMTTVLEDEVLAAPICMDLFHCIAAMQAAEGCKIIVIIDEARQMLMHPVFRKHFQGMLLDWGRKSGISVIAMFQDPTAVDQIDQAFAMTMRQAMPTKVIFPDRTAERRAYEAYNLNSRQWMAVRGESPQARWLDWPALVIRSGGEDEPVESMLLDFSTRALGDYAAVFRSGVDHRQQAARLIQADGSGLRDYIDWAARFRDGGSR